MKDEATMWELKKSNKPTKKLKPKSRFRALVRRVIHNLDWLVEVDEEDVKGGNNLQAKMNLIILRTKKKQENMLGLVEKSILMRDAESRTEEEKRRICFVIGALRCFRRYPEDVRRRLASTTYFQYCRANHVIVRQGHEAHALYFIMEGEVIVTVTSPDPMTGAQEAKEVGRMGNGEMFGEVSLLHNIPRTATITTSANCNLLCLKRKDFEAILKTSMIAQWDESRKAIRNIPYFDKWSEVCIRECCILSKIQKYEQYELILGDGFGQSAYVYFVISGQCQLVEAMRLAVRDSRDGVRYRLYDKKTKRLSLSEHSETFFMQVCRMKAGACFNIGESLGNRTMMAASQVQCLICPRYWILQNNPANIWNRVIAYLDSSVPNSKQIYQNFLEERRWQRYKEGLVANIAARHPRSNNSTSIHDVPYSLRIASSHPHDKAGYLKKAREFVPSKVQRKSIVDETNLLVQRHNSSLY